MEAAYFEGRYFYGRGEYTRAEPYLWYVYDQWRESIDKDHAKLEVEGSSNVPELYKELAAPAAHFLGNIARHEHVILDWELAETLLKDSIQLNRDLGLKRHEDEVRHTLGLLYLEWGRLEEAREEFRVADLLARYTKSSIRDRKQRPLKQPSDGAQLVQDMLSARIVGQYPTEPLSIGDEYRLQVRLQNALVERVRAFDITIRVSNARLASWHQTVELSPGQCARSDRFSFRPIAVGPLQIELDLYYERRWLQKLRLGLEAAHCDDG